MSKLLHKFIHIPKHVSSLKRTYNVCKCSYQKSVSDHQAELETRHQPAGISDCQFHRNLHQQVPIVRSTPQLSENCITEHGNFSLFSTISIYYFGPCGSTGNRLRAKLGQGWWNIVLNVDIAKYQEVSSLLSTLAVYWGRGLSFTYFSR